ncbi:hypothetical protein P2H44_06535 [Albimonas sp. CAU 1670]|uniref:hypothetical protein n=1 Tax=Albimonas sp. CAU 1670 TaxID=3032599 RepID=UPI0023DAECF2|nr:hypothetical protein [Albimonas sp. CAU 1670]MDF2232207.1 hypothetical protein [Albimonas sp. CAU 1670]
MTTADWALIVSLGSTAIALASLFWNIWSKFIYPKPRLRVGMSVVQAFGPGWEQTPPAVTIRATNYGPTEVTLKHAIARKRPRVFRNAREYGILYPYNRYPHGFDTDGPFGGGLPKKLAVGEEFAVYFPLEKSWFETNELDNFGFCDTFGRNHWAPKRDVVECRERVLREPENAGDQPD